MSIAEDGTRIAERLKVSRMRRSAAPSNAFLPVNKRPRFSVPLKGSTHQHVEKLKGKENSEVNLSFPDADVKSLQRNLGLQGQRNGPICLNSINDLKNSGNCGQQDKDTTIAIADGAEATDRYFNVVWCKASKKKHKKWDGDGILVVKGRGVTLNDTEGKRIAKAAGYRSSELISLKEGETLFVGGKEIKVMSEIEKDKYLRGTCYISGGADSNPDKPSMSKIKDPTVLARANRNFTFPGKEKSTLEKSIGLMKEPFPLHDPNAPNAVVFPRPDNKHQWNHNKEGLKVVDVVLDPFVARRLRPHQREGLLFLYECVNGMKEFQGKGAILADEMGLGKTIQCISLIWTLLKQGMYGAKPVVKRVLIITPGSLVKNWIAEFKKWLGNDRILIFAVDSTWKVEEFRRLRGYPVMVISYEMFLRYIEEVVKVKFDLVLCDEAHRLKNSAIKTTSALASLDVQRRVLLTGTPLQNDLQEFYTLADLANPGVLGSYQSFKNVFEGPISLSQQPSCTEEERELGQLRASELKCITSLFFLRRTSEINQSYLPPRVDYTIFAKMSDLQNRLYRCLLTSRAVRTCLSSSYSGSEHLIYISMLRKLCNDPCLLHQHCKIKVEEERCQSYDEIRDKSMYSSLLECFPSRFNDSPALNERFGKLALLSRLLCNFRSQGEKAVIVSNFTQTLDLVQRLCSSKGILCTRLDGKTPTNARQDIVNRFNKPEASTDVLLLSSKAGGTGLNLIGASRLVLYDVDWNPANDLQAMARIWRDGQKRQVYVYRILITGSIDEKIYQRQIMKQGLSGAVVDTSSERAEFSHEDLKDIFTLPESETCATHELLKCTCLLTGIKPDNNSSESGDQRACQLGASMVNLPVSQKKTYMCQLMDWDHVDCDHWSRLKDSCLEDCKELISFVFQTENLMVDEASV